MDPLLHEFLGTSGNEYPTTNKTEDEIKRLTLEEDMPEVKRATHILYRGQAIQKPSVYTNLYKILLEPESFSKVLPYIAEGILSQSGEIQIEAGRSLMKLMKNHELEEEQLLDIFRITMTVTTLWNQAVLDTWVLVFHELLKQLPYNMISAHCESSIVNLSDQSQHPLSKYAAGRMIGFIADQNIKPTEPLFDRARFLCQDSEVEVRKIMAQEVILKICRHVGASLTENKYLEKILELTYDSDSEVKMAAIESVVEALDILSFGFKRSKMVQVLMELANSTNEEVVKKMSFLIGKVIHKLEKIILGNPQLFSQIQNLVKEWASHKDLEIKKNVIYNIPYLIRIMGNKEFFKDIYIKATKDNNLEIRFIAMSSFHEVIKAYEVREAQIIFRETFESLFKEESIEILEKVVPHLAELLQVFQSTVEDETEDKEKDDSGKSKGKSKEIKEWKDWNGSTSDIDKSKESTKVCSKVSLDQRSCLEDLISIGTYLSFKHAWRLEIVFIENMNKCLDLFDLKELADVYVDYLIKGVSKSAKEVRRKLLETVVLYLAKNHYMAKTNEVMKKVVEEFANASTYQGRLAFLEFYEVCAGQFSRQFFKTYNMNELGLALGEDKVTEIKKKFLENAVLFKKMIGEEDKSSGAKLNEIISRNVKNSNKYIAQLASEKMKGLKFLTAAFFEEFDTENEERRQREEALQNKEKEEYETIKRRQQEVLLKERQDNFNALTSLLFGGRKGAKRTTWNDAYTIKLLKSTQSAAICLNETPKNKYIAPLVTLPALKTQKAPAIINSQSSQKELESKLNPAKLRRHVVTPLEPPVPKKKAGSFSVATKEKIQDLASLRVPVVDRERERRPSKERNLVSEPSAREVPEMKSNKFLPIKELKNKERKDGVRVPTIRKKNP